MPRPCCLRHIGFKPTAGFFTPAGVPACTLEQVTLTLDEVESLRLADLNGLYQEQAAEQMQISRPTFARIVEQARRKVAEALIHGKALRLEGGAVKMDGETQRPKGNAPEPVGPSPCGCGRRRGRIAGGFGRCRRHPGFAADPPTSEETRCKNRTEEGEHES